MKRIYLTLFIFCTCFCALSFSQSINSTVMEYHNKDSAISINSMVNNQGTNNHWYIGPLTNGSVTFQICSDLNVFTDFTTFQAHYNNSNSNIDLVLFDSAGGQTSYLNMEGSSSNFSNYQTVGSQSCVDVTASVPAGYLDTAGGSAIFTDNPNEKDSDLTTYIDVEAVVPAIMDEIEVVALDAFNLFKFTSLTEINLDYFELESSPDATNWRSLEVVYGTNSSSRTKYEIKDYNPEKLTYYRLKSVDFDGHTEYFEIVSAQRDSKNSLDAVKVFFDTNNELTLENLPLGSTTHVLNMSGNHLITSHYSYIDVSNLSTGIYVAVVEYEGNTITYKFHK